MAGDWIKIGHTLPGKPEVDLIAVALGIDHDAVIGKLVRLWIWADQQMVDCNGARVTESYLDRLTNCTGFAAALVDVGWLASRNGRLMLPNFDRHNGQTAKSRALTSSRVKRSRNGSSVTQSLPEKRREEKRREDTDSVSPPPSKSKHPSLTERARSAARVSRRPQLTEEALRSEPLLRAWVADEASRSDAKVDGSEATTANVLATAAKVLRDPTVRDKVAVAKWIIFGRRWEYLSASDDDAAKVLSRGSFTPSQFVLASNFAMRGVE